MRPLLLRLPNWLGDLVLAWPVIAAAGRDAPIYVGPAAFEPLLLARFPNARYLVSSRASRYASAGAIRGLRPRAALLLTESFSSALLAVLGGVPVRIGYGAEGRSFLLTRRVKRSSPARTTPRAEEYRVLALAAGLEAEPGEPFLEVVPVEREAGRTALANGLAGSGISSPPLRTLVIAPGAAYGPAKQWGGTRFGEAGASLAREHGLTALLVGSEADRGASADAAAVLREAGVPHVDLTGGTDLSSLVGLVGDSALVLTNDSGVMHLAAALRRPTVAVFGSTSPLWTSASAPWVSNLYTAYPCSPCFRRTCNIGYGCLHSISVPAVEDAARRLLG